GTTGDRNLLSRASLTLRGTTGAGAVAPGLQPWWHQPIPGSEDPGLHAVGPDGPIGADGPTRVILPFQTCRCRRCALSSSSSSLPGRAGASPSHRHDEPRLETSRGFMGNPSVVPALQQRTRWNQSSTSNAPSDPNTKPRFRSAPVD